MSRRKVTHTVHCAEPAGCRESSFYEFDSQRDMRTSGVTGKPWYCVRHTMAGRVLSPEHTRVEWVSEPIRQETYGRFWGHSGLLAHHEAFYAEAKDFPVGTRVKITCEVLLPEGHQ